MEEGTGAIATLDDFDRFPWPDLDAYDLSAFDDAARLLPPGMKILANLGCIFTAAWMLMGMENFFLALADNPELVRKVHGRIYTIQSRVLFRLFKFRSLGGVFHADDLASKPTTSVQKTTR